MNIYKDILGNIVRPGDLVICPALKYRSAELRTGVVEVVKPGGITVMRVTESYDYKNSRNVMNFRRYTTSSGSVVVIRWDLVGKDSKYYEILSSLREKVMKQ